MNRILKVFCTGADQEKIAEKYPTVEAYDGFVLVEIDEFKQDEIARLYPIEDITDQYSIRMVGQEIDTSLPRVDAKGKTRAHPAYKGLKRLAPGPHHHLIQFIGPIKAQWLDQVKKSGGEPRMPFEAFSYIVRADAQALSRIAMLPFVRWVGHLMHNHRLANSLIDQVAGREDTSASLPRTHLIPDTYVIEFFNAKDLRSAAPEIKALGFNILDRDHPAAILVVKDPKGGAGARKRLRELSAVHGVRYIRKQTIKRTSNDVATRIMGMSGSISDSGLGLTGEGEVIAICDTGLDTGDRQNIHKDFSGRVKKIFSYPITRFYRPYIKNPGADDGPADLDSGHGTHVAGSAVGDGAASMETSSGTAPIRGLAHKAKLVFQAVEQEMQWKNPSFYNDYGRYLLSGIPNDLEKLFADAYGQGARIHSNSWGGGEPGEYDSQSRQLDNFVWEHKDFCVLVACGNDGTDNDGDGQINPMSVTSPATSKNSITVGACENLRTDFDFNTYGRWWPSDYPVAPFRNDPMADNPDQVVAFSSRGPTQDGRTKPEVVAPGTFILSTRSTRIAQNNTAWSAYPPNRLYFFMGGTSMATPLTAGAMGLIREFLRIHQGIQSPSAALMKATLIAGTQRLAGYGAPGALVDNNQGYGRVHLNTVLAPAAPAEAVFMEETPGLETGEVFRANIQIQSSDVPLRAVMAYSDYPGSALINNLNLILIAPDGRRFVGNQSADGALTMDVKNNVEVIHAPNPDTGAWAIEVVGSNVPRGPQDFALVCLGHFGQAEEKEMLRVQVQPQLAIPDNDAAGVVSKLHIAETGTVYSVKVDIDIAHTYIGDLRVVLSAPDGTDVVLHNRTGARTRNLARAYDIQTTPELGQLKDKPVTGDWQLAVSDHAPIDKGVLKQWQLEIRLASARTIEKQSTPALSIPDNNPAGVADSIDVIDTGSVQDVRVDLDITHPWIGDLEVKLQAPDGTEVVLHRREGFDRDNLIKTYAVANLADLAMFNGTPAQGSWTLHAADLAGRDTGKLNHWSLRLTL